ncbi:NAD(P)-dependent dehydrogenase (short-subunit alcohol dehydrogenase family) [Mycolicibacterium mucogenicum 261Sha1.1M5]|nr:NAD(P)-dependent dehydrogenase (short-subunit alcohol dehydrogenase family) [Mycolicibacterium mucogenicum 261Sha1.1M5]
MRTVIVTGSAGGMGAAIAARLTDEGFLVAGFDRKPAPSAASHWILDVADGAAVAEATAEVAHTLGPVYGLVNAAGHYESLPFAEVTDDDARAMLRAHLGGFFATARAVIPPMLEAGSGRIVAITSELAVGGGARDSHYSAAKGAILGAMRSLAAELAGTGITVNSVAPGPTNTPMLAADSPWRDSGYLSTLPTRMLAEPTDIAACVSYLIGSSGFITGETLHPNSGAVI